MSTSSPFTFHCIVCYDQFHPEERYPVVLPCGHTYVCVCCADQLSRCVECRQPIHTSNEPKRFQSYTNRPYTASSTKLRRAATSVSLAGSNRVIGHQNDRSDRMEQSSKQSNRSKLPKNVVLMSLMEATATANACFKPSNDESCVSTQLLPIEEEQQDEEARIMLSTRISTGYCGTYSVANKDGLAICTDLPSDLRRGMETIETSWDHSVADIIKSTTNSKESVSTFLGKGLSSLTFERTRSDLASWFSQESEVGGMRLKFGDRVQVVTFIKGYAKLARGYGFVRCDQKNDLIKVSGPVDRACCLEAMIEVLSQRHREVQRERGGVEKEVVSLLNQLRSTMKSSEDVTVVDGAVFSGEKSEAYSQKADNRDDWFASRESTPVSKDSNNTEDRESTDLKSVSDNDDVLSMERKNSFLGGIPFTNYADSIFRSLHEKPEDKNSGSQDKNNSQTAIALLESSSFGPSVEIVEGAREWRRRNGREATSGTDFRTGRSGHSGLLSSHQHQQESIRHDRPLMSCHSGLTLTHRLAKHNSMTGGGTFD